jgi:hypothetical protein
MNATAESVLKPYSYKTVTLKFLCFRLFGCYTAYKRIGHSVWLPAAEQGNT